jgi:miniconductance mechanosensitive channel
MFEQLQNIHPLLPTGAGLISLIAAAIAANLIVKHLLLRIVRAVARRSLRSVGDALIRHRVFARFSQVVPAVLVSAGIDFVPELSELFVAVIKSVSSAYIVLIFTLTLTAVLGAGLDVYNTYPSARTRPLKGMVQLLQIVIYVLGAIIVVAELADRSPLLFLSGFGAMTAVLLLVFKDTILGLVASVQLSANDMVRVGDWIEMPQFGADGDVIDVALHTVKVQNWDKTITAIPTYKLIAESFKNWRGMSDSGGRRIKRAIYVDQSSIGFLSGEEAESLKRFSLLSEYIDAKRRELDEFSRGLGDKGASEVNRRRLTNIGTFRAYVFNYLNAHPQINTDMTLLVRQLMPGPDGLPIEIYCFTKTTEWRAYEDIQSDIFDHTIAILPEFGLRLFQRPTGSDLGAVLRSANVAPPAADTANAKANVGGAEQNSSD